MRFFLLLLLDIVLILLATLSAILLRDNFETSPARLMEVLPYLISTVAVSALILPLFGINRAIWRFTAMPDYLRAVGAVAAIVVSAVAVAFAVNRLELVPRSLPFLQFNLAITFLIGSRVLYRVHHIAKRSRRQPMAPLKVVDEAAEELLLLVGLSPLTEIYLQSVAEFAPKRIRIAGILAHKDRHVGRLVAAHKVLGLPEHLERVLSELEVTGVAITRIVITASVASLSRTAREALEAIERKGSIQVQYLSAELGFEAVARPSRGATTPGGETSSANVEFEIRSDDLALMQQRAYWKVKRAIDVSAAAFLLVLTAPVQIAIGLAVAASMGWPLVFWQRRPGLGGRAFQLHKFRTMGDALAADGRRLPDEARVSRIGNFLRRTRLDELPQLFSILRGHMSFIGPRPLLPCDQDEAYRARLLVRPGLTGWAQVIGGRAISPADKAALDVWYVRNASLRLDIEIVLRTIPMVFIGERVSETLIRRAWQDLSRSGVLKVKGGLSHVHTLRSKPVAA
jgi:lipopolysaccharide/colanic/teichoic acid biosynthesis glycosyltransferase